MAPVIQFKRGVLANLPGLRAGEPGLQPTLTTSMWVLIPQQVTTNLLDLKDSGTLVPPLGSGVKLVEGTDNGVVPLHSKLLLWVVTSPL